MLIWGALVLLAGCGLLGAAARRSVATRRAECVTQTRRAALRP
jgi:hypothetical protein